MEKLKREGSGYVAMKNVNDKIDEMINWVNSYERPTIGPSTNTATMDSTVFPFRGIADPGERFSPLKGLSKMTIFEVSKRFRDVALSFQSFGDERFVFQGWDKSGKYSIRTVLNSYPGLIIDASELRRFGGATVWHGIYIVKDHVVVYKSGIRLPDHVA